MAHRYTFKPNEDEQQPLDNLNSQFQTGRRRELHQTSHEGQHTPHEAPDYESSTEPYYDEPPHVTQQEQFLNVQRYHGHRTQHGEPHKLAQPSQLPSSRPFRSPASHPDSAYNLLSAHRSGVPDKREDMPLTSASMAAPGLLGATSAAGFDSRVAPPPPPHHDLRQFDQQRITLPVAPLSQANVTPGADNFSESAGGGMAGLAYGVAERNPRESGVDAMRASQQQQQFIHEPHNHECALQTYEGGDDPTRLELQNQGSYVNDGSLTAEGQVHFASQNRFSAPGSWNADRNSRSSMQAIKNAGLPPGSSTPDARTPSRSPHSFANEVYTDSPYQRYSTQDAHLGFVNPTDIEDDGDDGLEYHVRNARTSMLSLAGYSSRSGSGAISSVTAGAAVLGAVAGGSAAALGARHLAKNSGGHDGYSPDGGVAGKGTSSDIRYNAINNGRPGFPGDDGIASSTAYDLGRAKSDYPAKSEWLSQESRSSKRWKWAIIIGIAIVVVAGIVCGVVFGVVLRNKNGSNGGNNNSQTASGDSAANGDLGINSPEIQKLLNNKKLHRIFPGIDYTPINTQYPQCLSNPPSQNNVTRDIAVLSQLTNTIRLYGTDCNQTEMTIHAIKQLKLQDTVKIWMGVWQDNNKTTNARQLAQMWDVLEKQGGDPFEGIIVANEILFREQMSVSQLSSLLESVRTNLTGMDIKLPVATSDLGTVWDASLAEASDYVMANIHPFFGGVNAKDAASWTWNFWKTNDGPVFKSDNSKNIISETGWPSQGGTDCGTGSTDTSCPDASVAGISQLNEFLAGWVCDALKNGTRYFWFEAFDEPWKILYDTDGKDWEDHWGILDVNRNLKAGVNIPDCGGQTV